MEIPIEQGGESRSVAQCHAVYGLETGPPLTKTPCSPLQHAFTRVQNACLADGSLFKYV